MFLRTIFQESELPKQLQAAVSHWRHEATPALNIINGYTNLLRQGILGSLTDEQRELLRVWDSQLV